MQILALGSAKIYQHVGISNAKFWRQGPNANPDARYFALQWNIGFSFYCSKDLIYKPIFHWKWGSRWVPNANEIYTKNMKCTWPTPVFCIGTQRNLYSTDWCRGLASGKTQILALGSRWVPNANEIYTKNMKCTWPPPVFCIGTQRNLYSTDWCRGLASGKTQILALGNAKIYQHVGISNAKFWRRGPNANPDARYFASQWNIGFSFYCSKDLIYKPKFH